MLANEKNEIIKDFCKKFNEHEIYVKREASKFIKLIESNNYKTGDAYNNIDKIKHSKKYNMAIRYQHMNVFNDIIEKSNYFTCKNKYNNMHFAKFQ